MSPMWVRRRPIPGAWALLIVGLLVGWRWLTAAADPPSIDPARMYLVVAIERGDTLVLAEGQRVRLIGVRSRPAAATSDWLELAATGKEVRLEFDRHRRDDSGAWLAYVYAGDTFLNAEFLRAGLGWFDPGVSLRSDRERALRGAAR